MSTEKSKALDQALKNIDGWNKFASKKEIKELPSLLWEDELPEAMVGGRYNNGNGILVATNRRALFIDKGMMSLKVEDFPYDKLSSIEFKTGMLMGEITLYTSGNKAQIKNIEKGRVRPFAEYLRARVSSILDHASIPTSTTNSDAITVVEQLERLAKLKEQGILTDSEFADQKSKILES
ncbi:PH domain-containing protein [Dehalococcoides mccartyi]|nr:PH domain-containing protein [Dehalococcoides mccartyi]